MACRKLDGRRCTETQKKSLDYLLSSLQLFLKILAMLKWGRRALYRLAPSLLITDDEIDLGQVYAL